MEIKCSIIKDLLPSYVDDLCSDDTKALVDEHISACVDCAKILWNMKNETVEKTAVNAIATAKAKEPFKVITKKNKRRIVLSVLITALTIIIVCPIFFFSLNQIRGEGITFTAISATIETKKLMNSIEQGKYKDAAEVVGFWGFSETDRLNPNVDNIPTEKERFVEGLSEYFAGDVRFITYRDVHFNTNDHYTQGTVIIDLESDTDSYCFRVNISKQAGKLCPMSVEVIATSNDEIAEELANNLSEIICTHYSG